MAVDYDLRKAGIGDGEVQKRNMAILVEDEL